ncbi:MAG: phosphohydrolase, partial [Flavobacterium sp.]|nr:phosphohydrolase [Flavobacterium sp.]
VAELMLMNTLKRAKALLQKGISVEASKPLLYFMQHSVSRETFADAVLDQFAQLDDYDIISAIKAWQFHDDFILSNLSKMIINRDLLKVKLSAEKFPKESLTALTERYSAMYNLSAEECSYFIFKGKIKNQAYNNATEPIRILKKDKTIEDVIEVSDQLNLKALAKPVTKYYLCFPKQLL